MRRIPVPPHRFTPLKANWEKVVTTIVVINKFKIGKYEVTSQNELIKKMR
jgi:hypothetical protein